MTFKDNSCIVEFWRGFGQILDIRGMYSSDIREKYMNISSAELDYLATKSDWEAVGNDMQYAMGMCDARKK